jgi:diguanylate cyclase (GGDEF)-like protein
MPEIEPLVDNPELAPITLPRDTRDDHDVDTGEQDVRKGSARILRISPADNGAGLREIDSDSFVFGRDRSCDEFVEDTSASRQHARLVKYGDRWVIVDLGSTNGTYVNDHRVQIQQLDSGDCIRVGRWTYKFFAEGDIEADYHKSVYEMMTRDELTGAWNRRYFMDVLEREICRHRRSNQPLAILMVNFDYFAAINEEHGHIVGDEVLAEFGRRARNGVRACEVFARYHGDSFAFILVNTNRDELKSAAKRIRSMVVGNPFQTSAGELKCSVSFGYSVGKVGSKLNGEQLVAAAEKSLIKRRQAKQSSG